MSKQYPEKAIMIMDGVISLIRSGNKVAKITSSEIASAAGVGKGTIYEYFSSKEEIISQTFLYSINNQINEFERQVASKSGFHEKFSAIVDAMLDCSETHNNLILIFEALGGIGGIFDYVTDTNHEELCTAIERIRQITSAVIIEGISEGILNPINDANYIEHVVTCCIMSLYKSSVKSRMRCGDIDKISTSQYAVTMLIKSLN